MDVRALNSSFSHHHRVKGGRGVVLQSNRGYSYGGGGVVVFQSNQMYPIWGVIGWVNWQNQIARARNENQVGVFLVRNLFRKWKIL